MSDNIIMERGKIYFISFGSTELVARFDYDSTTNYHFFDYLHYWNKFEKFHQNKPYCVKSGVELIRAASKAEKWKLVQEEIENGTI